ncbi:hypothetical protein OAK90_00175 [bacterium]|nr:hypothetical protein [Verrucomicrobiota bacterium]MDA7625045.1 hypothetical protein [bacterium]MDC0276854.1 hypothetical protein [bacterium]MDC0309609.1 hypothetical protein [bacterium]
MRPIVLLLAGIFLNAGQSVQAQPYGDCHFHLLDFLQNGEFDNRDGAFPCNESGLMKDGRYFQLPYGERHRRLTGLIDVTEKHNIADVVVCGMPFVKKWAEDDFFLRPKYYLDSSSRVKAARDTDLQVAAAFMDYKRQFAGDKTQLDKLTRLHPFVCGLDTTDLGAVDLAIKRIREYPGVWEGLGELMSRHDDLTNLTTGERPRANHPSFIRLLKFAGRVSLPVSIHHNVAPISRNESEFKQPLYLDEFLALLKNTIHDESNAANRPKVIWCHAGISRRIVVKNYRQTLERILDDYHENLYLDLSWVVLGTYVYKNLDEWVALIQKYPDNFLIGSDSVGKYSGIPMELKKYQALLSALPAETRSKVAYKNLASILDKSEAERHRKGFGKGGITLPHEFSLPENFGLEGLGKR